MSVNHSARLGGILGIYFRFSLTEEPRQVSSLEKIPTPRVRFPYPSWTCMMDCYNLLTQMHNSIFKMAQNKLNGKRENVCKLLFIPCTC